MSALDPEPLSRRIGTIFAVSMAIGTALGAFLGIVFVLEEVVFLRWIAMGAGVGFALGCVISLNEWYEDREP